MKRSLLLIASLLILQTGFSYSWESFGPENIKAYNIIFFHEPFINTTSIIISDSGFYLVENTGEYEYIPIAIKDACAISSDKIAVLISEGSYSDGIWSFDMETYELSVLKYCIYPGFIMYDKYNGDYFAGYESGLIKSSDGFSWADVPYFNGKNCTEMAVNNEQLAVNVSDDNTQIHFSTDNGNSWSAAANNPQIISAIDFYEGILFGIFPSVSNSSGLWQSNDFGDNWEVSFYSLNMSDVFSLNNIILLLGWGSPSGDYEGIAICDPFETPPELTFLNEGLPNTGINKINGIELLEDPVEVYVCTNSGVFVTTLFLTGLKETETENVICVYPNPFSEQLTIRYNLEREESGTLEIFDLKGEKVFAKNLITYGNDEQTTIWVPESIPEGEYLIRIMQGKYEETRKVIYTK